MIQFAGYDNELWGLGGACLTVAIYIALATTVITWAGQNNNNFAVFPCKKLFIAKKEKKNISIQVPLIYTDYYSN